MKYDNNDGDIGKLKKNHDGSELILMTHHSAFEEELVLVHVEFARGLQNFGTHLERKQEFVAFEKTTASVPKISELMT